jgi:hypothetical protein
LLNQYSDILIGLSADDLLLRLLERGRPLAQVFGSAKFDTLKTCRQDFVRILC